MATFPSVKRSKRGYDPEEVDRFLRLARRAYEGDPEVPLVAEDIRRMGFDLQRGGYQPDAVDGALERLEDAFAARERAEARHELGDRRWLEQARGTAQVILNRLGRPDGQRFDRTSIFTIGYNKREVDKFAKRLVRYFRDGLPMSVDEVRTVVFRQQRHGYREAQVDLVLDAVIDVMLAVR
ncbi:DivIVA domain-containing protein [Humibacter ginsenosidimutans]|uniref:DivIVA domain-containing protein n=1 Tax=Humibacter ginsenosidimutans TaxID=2599293 RepID=A0A5B8M2R5_9MICO|nr:DivIVA domain-containing protein [Humibacter ginsenosidimutans]QDZ14075.1 DivIVA domain-containing protein [Humibacter ginsenosidimutans]